MAEPRAKYSTGNVTAPATAPAVEPSGELRPMRPSTPFLLLWTAAIVATVAAFVLHLALRGQIVSLGYDLGRARAEQARLREVKRVLQVEAASYKTPERVEMVARQLLGMEPPTSDRIIPVTSSLEIGGAGVRGRDSALASEEAP